MRKVRSRNFILIVCGVLITLLLGFVIATTIINVIDEMNNKYTDEEIGKNILSSSSKIKLNGKGNFIDSTPRVEKTMISEFNVRLSGKDDEVFYSLSFCNMNEIDLKYEDLVVEVISCIDNLGNTECNNIYIDSYVAKQTKKLEVGEMISANSCVDVTIDAKYIGESPIDTEVSISKVVLELVDSKR